MSNRTYDILKWVALVALDALGLLYSTLATIWGLPYGEQILKTCTAVSLCLGAMIGVTGKAYNASGIDDDGREDYEPDAETMRTVAEIVENIEEARAAAVAEEVEEAEG